MTSSSHSTCGCIASVGTGLCGTAYLFILHHSPPVVTSSAHATHWCSTSVGTGLWLAALLRRHLWLCGTAYLFILHRSPVVTSSAQLTHWCSASVGTELWPAALSLCQLGCVGLASRTASLRLFPPGARRFGSVLGKVRCVCDRLPFCVFIRRRSVYVCIRCYPRFIVLG